MKKKVFKNILKFSFFVSFIILSIQSISSYLRGEVNIENINELNEDLVFPSITICPRPKEAIINLKTDRLAADLNISIERTLTGQIFELIRRQEDPLSFVANYTFSKEEIFPRNSTKSWLLWVETCHKEIMNIFCLDCQSMELLFTLHPCMNCTVLQKISTKSFILSLHPFSQTFQHQLASEKSRIILEHVLTCIQKRRPLLIQVSRVTNLF